MTGEPYVGKVKFENHIYDNWEVAMQILPRNRSRFLCVCGCFISVTDFQALTYSVKFSRGVLILFIIFQGSVDTCRPNFLLLSYVISHSMITETATVHVE